MQLSLRVLLLTLIGLMAACGKVVVMKHNETGDIKKCETPTSATGIGAYLGRRDVKRCVEALESEGYRKTNI